jgi:hypothetical protein
MQGVQRKLPAMLRHPCSLDRAEGEGHDNRISSLSSVFEDRNNLSDGQELNKGESRNSLARAVFIHRLGDIRDRTDEKQQHRASGLNLAYLSPLGWEQVNLTGDDVWVTVQSAAPTNDEPRPLRTPPTPFPKAA